MIFFDLDGTLLDHEKAEREGAAAFQQRHSEVFSEPASSFLERWHAASEKHMNRFLRNETTEQGQRRARMRELFSDPDMTDPDADEIFEYYLQTYQGNWCVFADVMDCLKKLQGLPLGIITNGGPTQQRKKLADVKIKDFFSVVVISGEVGVSKSDPGIFSQAAARAHVDPEMCVYVGDRLQTDAEAASRVGFCGIWLDRKGSAKGKADTPVLQSLKELPLFIETHNKRLHKDAASRCL